MNAVQMCDALHHINRVKTVYPKLNPSSYELAMEYIRVSKDTNLTLDDFLKGKLAKHGIKK